MCKKVKPQTVHASQLKLAHNPSIYRVANIVDDVLEETPSGEESVSLSQQQQKQLDDTLALFPSVFSDGRCASNDAIHWVQQFHNSVGPFPGGFQAFIQTRHLLENCVSHFQV